MAAGALTVAALVLLAGRLPGHAKLGGDLRPPDAQVYGMIDQRCEFRLGLLLYGLHRQTKITVPARNQETAHHPRGMFPRQLAPSAGSGPSTASCHAGQARAHSCRPNSRGHCLPPFATKILRGIHRCLVLPEGESPWTSGCAGRFGGLSRTTGAAPSCPVLTRFAPAVSGTSSLSRTCVPDLDISRRTLYEWRVKDRAPRVHHVSVRRPACPPLRISALAVCPFTRQAMTTDTRGQICMSFYGKAGRFPSGTEGDYPAEEFWA